MKVSVIAPVRGSLDRALRVLEPLTALPPFPQHECVIVDATDGALDPIVGCLDGQVRVVHVEGTATWSEAARAGMAAASGDVLTFMDHDVEVGPNWLAPLIAAVQGPGTRMAISADPADRNAAHTIAATKAFAVRRRELEAVGGIPPVSDDLVMPATVLALAARCDVVQVDESQAVRRPVPRVRGRHLPGTDPEITIVVPTLDATSEQTQRCLWSLQEHTDVAYDIVVVDNGAPPQGFTAPVNAGLRAARGRYVVVCNDDVEVLSGWWAPLKRTLDSGASIAYPMTVGGVNRRDFAAWFFAMTRASLVQHGVTPQDFFRPELRIWYQDTDLLHRLRMAGNPPVLVPQSRIRHGLSKTVLADDPVLKHWVGRQVRADKVVFEALHGTNVPGAAVGV